ncbi:hypothetical protein CR513_26219, partial [Mucuna pruriens]
MSNLTIKLKSLKLELDSKPGNTLIAKGDKFSLKQCPKNDLERNEMQKMSYASVVGNLMCAQVYTRPDIAFVLGVLDRYLSDSRTQHWNMNIKLKWEIVRNL